MTSRLTTLAAFISCAALALACRAPVSSTARSSAGAHPRADAHRSDVTVRPLQLQADHGAREPPWNRYAWCSLAEVQQALAAGRYADALRFAIARKQEGLSAPERMWLEIYS